MYILTKQKQENIKNFKLYTFEQNQEGMNFECKD